VRAEALLVLATLISLVGLALSGLAHSIDRLVGFRAVQALGVGGLMVGTIATQGDLVPRCSTWRPPCTAAAHCEAQDRPPGCRPARHAIVLLTAWGGGQYGCGSPGAGDPANS
jgi:hypothetical protein